MKKNGKIKSEIGRRRNMFENRIDYINLIGEINYESANQTIHHILQASKRSDAIVLCMSTCGGDIYAGMSIIETMKFVEVPVFTHALGLIASMGVNIYLEGQKRFMAPTASFMIHGSSVEYSGSLETIESTLNYEKYFDNYLNERIVATTKFTREALDKLLNKKIDVYFTPNKTVEYGFIENENYIVKSKKEMENKIDEYLKRDK